MAETKSMDAKGPKNDPKHEKTESEIRDEQVRILSKYARMEPEEKQKIPPAAMREMCSQIGLEPAGTRVTLIARLDLKTAGLFEKATVCTNRYAGRYTRCPLCGYTVMVNGTSSEEMSDGRLIKRSMKCTGPKNHRFTLKDIVTPIKMQEPEKKATA